MLQNVRFLSVFLLLQICCRVGSHKKSQSLTFAAVGDFGGTPSPPYYTNTQMKVAKVMGKYADVKFVLGLGDNFYYKGVRTVEDPRFTATFEHVYTSPSLKAATWYMIAGNHDHRSNVSAQIAYTKISPRWHFPDFFYTKVLKLPETSKTVQLVMLDTTMLCCRSQLEKLRKFPSQQYQLAWINDTLRSSTADYLIVAGHHPVFSAGSHANTRYLETKLKPLLEENNVTVYLSGHDHSLQHFKEDNSTVNYFVSGAGGGNFHRRSHWNTEHHKIVSTKLKFFNGYYGAFTLFEATPEYLKITQINENGKELNKAQLRPRNSRTVVPFDFIKPKTQPARLTPSTKPASKPKLKPNTNPNTKPTLRPESTPTLKPKSKPTLKPKSRPTLKPKLKLTLKPILVPRGISNPGGWYIPVLLAVVGTLAVTGVLCALWSSKAFKKTKSRKTWTRVPEESSQESEPEN